MPFGSWKNRASWIFSRKSAESELDEEIRAHLAIEARQRIEAGETPESAQAAARREFGNELLVKEATRGVWRQRWVEDLVRDLIYSARMLRKNPGFAIVAILTLALGIGCNTAMFSIINAVLLRPLPFHQPDRLIYMLENQRFSGLSTLNGQDYLDWREQNHTLEDAALFGGLQSYNVSGAGPAETVPGVMTEASFFSVLGVEPIRGRRFTAGEDRADGNHAVILSYGFWRRHYAGFQPAIGAKLLLDLKPYTVIGVMPSWFNLPSTAQLWIPLDMSAQRHEDRGNHSFRAIARLKPGMGLNDAKKDLDAISARLGKEFPKTNEGETAALQPLKERYVSDSRQQLLVLMTAVGLVLLVACANVANLLLARATGRQREMSLRAALGATRLRLMRQLLTEGVLLSFLGGVAGLLLAYGSVALVQTTPNLPIPRVTQIQIDLPVLLFAGVVCIVAGLAFGSAPAFQISLQKLSEELRNAVQSQSSPAGWRSRVRNGLVIAEIALCLALLMGAGVLLRTFVRLRSTDIGIARENVTTMSLVLPLETYKTVQVRVNFYRQLLDGIRAEPGVQSAAVSLVLPLEGTRGRTLHAGGHSEDETHQVQWNVVTEDYFRTLGIPILSGRSFTEQDLNRTAEVEGRLQPIRDQNPASNEPAMYPVIVNHALAQALFTGQQAVGQQLVMGADTGQIVGVVGDVKQEDIRQPAQPEAYGPLSAEIYNHWYPAAISIRSTTSAETVLAGAKHALAELDSGLSFFNTRSMDQVIADNMQDTSLETILLGTFAAIALLLAGIGLYGVMAYAVAQRTREIGIRMALGAQPRSVLSLVARYGGSLTLAGVVLGVPSAIALTRLMGKLLFGVGPTDPVTFATVALLLGVVAMTACLIPARRAMRIDPMSALRHE